MFSNVTLMFDTALFMFVYNDYSAAVALDVSADRLLVKVDVVFFNELTSLFNFVSASVALSTSVSNATFVAAALAISDTADTADLRSFVSVFILLNKSASEEVSD